ncbi:hypothetical protein AFLA_007617 [Aspergillus flavus NRRL3357]|nr:hypothetical protein AFLA_007617 [Aspergillus flavus NRRL3357]
MDSLSQNLSALGIAPNLFTEPRKALDHSSMGGRQLLCHRPLRTGVAPPADRTKRRSWNLPRPNVVEPGPICDGLVQGMQVNEVRRRALVTYLVKGKVTQQDPVHHFPRLACVSTRLWASIKITSRSTCTILLSPR